MGKKSKYSPPRLAPQTEAALRTALLHQKSGNIKEAMFIISGLLKQSPKNPAILLHAGNLAWAANNLDQAILCYQKSLAQAPNYIDVIGNLGAVLWMTGRQDEAISCYNKVIKLDPNNAQAFYNLGGAWNEKRAVDKATKSFLRAIQLNPGHSAAWKTLGNCYNEEGKYPDAMKCYKKVVSLTQTGGSIIRVATTIPMIPESMENLREIRLRLDRNLDQLLKQQLCVLDPATENGYTNFFLAYHGEDDRSLQEKYTQVYIDSCSMLGQTAPHCLNYQQPAAGKRIKVAFASKNLMNHSIGNTSKGLIALLSREEFEVSVLTMAPPNDETSAFIAKNCDHFIVLPSKLEAAIATISSLELDILYYQDTGLDPFLFFLAFTRLAPIQCTSFGHPVTTGIPNLDYYISTDLWEPEDGDSHYSENLIRLQKVASVAYYYRPPVNEMPRVRSDYGLLDDDHIYICPQTLFKFHPDFDKIMKGILEADPAGKIVLIEGIHANWSEILRTRFKSYMPEVARRILFLPRQSGIDFINLIAISDVMLDTMHFNGFNTTLQGFCVGTPVVTLPGEFMRGRHTMSFYIKMDYMDMVVSTVEEYVQLALRLGTDEIFRAEASKIILDRSEVLWEEKEVIHEFEKFFVRAVNAWPNITK